MFLLLTSRELPVLTQTAASGSTLASAHSIYCRFLLERAAYQACHIRVPDVAQRLSAIALAGRFYSFFRVVPEAHKALAIATRLGQRDDEIAMTLTKRGYIIWVNEPQATFAPPTRNPLCCLKPTFGPSPCLILAEPTSYTSCSFKVPDLNLLVDGICFNGNYYSLFRKLNDAAEVIELAAKLTRTGDETVMTIRPEGFALAVKEPNAAVG